MTTHFNSIPVNFNSFGKGPAVVLLHGFLENQTMWNDILPNLSRRHRVVTVDLLGHGDTGCLGYVHTMEDMARAVKTVLSHLRLRRVKLIGHSMGGYVALALAELFPQLVKSVCLMHSSPQSDSKERKKNRVRAIEAVKQNHKNFVRVSVANLFSPNNRDVLKFEVKKVQTEALKISVQGIVSALEGMKARQDRTVFFRDFIGPKMMVIGRQDPVLEADVLIDIAQQCQAETVILPDGHMGHIENKTELERALLSFVRNP